MRAKTGMDHKSCTRCGDPRVEARGFCRTCYDKARNRSRLASGACPAARGVDQGARFPISLDAERGVSKGEREVRVPKILVSTPCPRCGAPPIYGFCLLCTPGMVPEPFAWPVVSL